MAYARALRLAQLAKLVTGTESPLWRYCSSLSVERINRLLGYADFDAVIELVDKFSVEQFAWESPSDERLRGCRRASFLLQVSKNAYDAFFNSPVGYRGQYAKSPRLGESANRLLIERMRERLVTFGVRCMPTSLQLVERSIDANDAKLWILESEVAQHLGGDAAEIFYGPWERTSPRGVGLRAPLGGKLEMKGGWLDAQGNEVRDPFKSCRSDEIHEAGFS